ncbi:MAG: PAS domain S-box protein [Thermodesulfovibrionaceae bacterium]
MFKRRYALSIVLFYALIGALWIVFSDRILASLIKDFELYARFQTYKGWFYVCATAILLYLLIKAYVSRVERYERELKKQLDYNRLLFEKSSMGLALCRMDGTLIDVNEAYAKIIGRTVEETLKLTYWDITPEEYREQELKQLESLRQTGKYGPYEKHYIHKDGHLVPVRLQGILIKINGEEFIWSSVEDITELKKSEEALRESEKKYREVVDNANSVILRWSFDGDIIFINKFGEAFFGFSPGELIGRNVIGTIVPERETTGRDLKELISSILKNTEKFEYSINENIKKNGERVWIFWVNKVIYDEQGKPKEILSIGTDITELKQTHEELKKYKEHLEELVHERTRELEEANEKLKELDRLKSMFIASMSHELRTPLNSIIGFSSILLNEWLGPLNEEQKLNIATINRAGKHLLALINDVIDVSKIEAGVIDRVYEDFELSELIREAIKNFENEITQKGLQLISELSQVDMHTDRRRLLQCVMNLLSNAVKFTEKGFIKISSFVNRDFVEIIVEDSGRGIKEEDLSKLFKPFQRFEMPDKAKIPGTGLGLYLTKKIVTEILKGDITVESKYGVGSKFILKIPVKLN